MKAIFMINSNLIPKNDVIYFTVDLESSQVMVDFYIWTRIISDFGLLIVF